MNEYIGFQRTQDECGGEWSMAKYIEATETEDEDRHLARAQPQDSTRGDSETCHDLCLDGLVF